MEYDNFTKEEKIENQVTPLNSEIMEDNLDKKKIIPIIKELNQILNTIFISLNNTEAENSGNIRGTSRRYIMDESTNRRKASTAGSVDHQQGEGHDRSPIGSNENEECEEDLEFEYYRKLTVVKNERYKYIGEMRNGSRDGFGICYYATGEVYTGQWKEDKMEGFGKFMFPTGDVQIGELKENKFEGYSEVFNYKKDFEIRGYTVNGKFSGEIYAKFGEASIEGGSLINYQDDSGIIINSNTNPGPHPVCQINLGNSAYYLGEVNISPNNFSTPIKGIYVKKKEFIYLGELAPSTDFLKNNFNFDVNSHGYGEFYYPDLSRFFGFYHLGVKQGLGLTLNPEGKLIFGKYKNDYKTGAFFTMTKSANSNSISSMKMEIYHLGFKSKTVEKQDTIKKYLPLNYPEFSQILNFNYKNILDKIWTWDLKENEDLLKDVLTLEEENLNC